MASVYKKKGSPNFFASVYDPSHQKFRDLSTRVPNSEENRAKAQRVADGIERHLAESAGVASATRDGITVAAYMPTMIAARKARGVADTRNEEGLLRNHLLAAMGSMRVKDVGRHDCRAFVRQLTSRCPDAIASRTVHNIATICKALFDEAEEEGLIAESPWKLGRRDLPPKRDKDPEWRAGALFTIEELGLLLSLNDHVPPDRRIFYALEAFAGPRFGGVAALKWKHIDCKAEPLARLLIAWAWNSKRRAMRPGGKTGTPRIVPIHPHLARALARWREQEWPWMMGRQPEPEDLVVPSRRGQHRNVSHMHRRFQQDLARLGLRARRQHDLRRSFISVARDAGARKEVLEIMTHNAHGDVVDAYTTFSYATMCEQIEKLPLQLSDRRTDAYATSPPWIDWYALRGASPPALSCSLPAARAKGADSLQFSSGADGTRTRGLRRDRPAL